jgi:serine/threonine-protein kinase HipA
VNLFCFLTGNSDMHLKNFSLTHSAEGEIRLTPAYDLLPVALLLPEDTEDTALALHGKKNKLKPGDFQAFGETLKLSERQISNALKRFEKGLGAANALIDAGFCSDETKHRYHTLLTDRWSRLTAQR